MKELQKLKEGVYWTGNRVVYPLKKRMDEKFSLNNFDMKNFLGIRDKTTFFLTLLIIFILLVGAYTYKHDTKECFELLENPILHCSRYLYNYTIECSEELEILGLCNVENWNLDINFSLTDLGGKMVNETVLAS